VEGKGEARVEDEGKEGREVAMERTRTDEEDKQVLDGGERREVAREGREEEDEKEERQRCKFAKLLHNDFYVGNSQGR
jgi:IMP dehydrogenase/GMP reductase